MSYSQFVVFLWVITPSFILAFLIRSIQRSQKQNSRLQYLYPFVLGLLWGALLFYRDGLTENLVESLLKACQTFLVLFFISLPASMTVYLKDRPDWLVPVVIFTLLTTIVLTIPSIS